MHFISVQNIQHREDRPEKFPKIKNLGIWGQDYYKLKETVELAKSLERGR